MVNAESRGLDTLLGSLALLRINALPDDHISSFVPFLASLFIDEEITEVSVDSLVSEFPKKYGFIIPRMPMVAILKKCTASGIIHRENDGRFYVIKEIAKQYCFSKQVKTQSQKYMEIIDELIQYTLSNRHIKLTREFAETILLAFLQENSSKTLHNGIGDYEFYPSDVINSKNFFLIAEFVKYCEKEKADSFKIIQDIATAHIIASAVVCDIEDTDSDNTHFQYHSLILYLDTPLVLRILGLNSDEMQVSYGTLFKELRSRNNKFKIFQHTFEEIHGILVDCERWIDNPQYNARYASQALKTFVAKKYSKGDIGLIIETLDQKLKENYIDIDETDYYSSTYNHLQIDDEPIRDAIISTYKTHNKKFNPIAKSTTIECDVKSISAIFKLRRNKVYRSYSKAKYLFMTNNTTLAYISRYFTREQNPSYSHHIYPCVTDVLLGTTIWLAAPVQKIDSFSRIKLLADCSAALLPSDDLVIQLSESIEKLYKSGRISKENYYLLKIHAFDTNYLLNKTLNDEDEFSDKITEEILEEIKEEIVAPYIKKTEEQHSEIVTLKQREQELITEKNRRKQKDKTRLKVAEAKAIREIEKRKNFTIPITIILIGLVITLVIIKINYILTIALSVVSVVFALLGTITIALMNDKESKYFKKLKNKYMQMYLANEYIDELHKDAQIL